MKNILILIAGFCLVRQTQAQTIFINNGTIEYERKINVHRQFESENNDDSEWFKDFLTKQPKFHTSYFQLSFNKDKAIYQPGKEADAKMEPWMIGPAKENSVLTDFNGLLFTSRKTVFEQTFIVADSTNRLQWKLSSETRTIAGFECRKAVTVICDSVYVVAFYTEEIPVSGGPESFGGLPGMILGLAVPRLYSTWYATKVELNQPPASVFAINGKGKKITSHELAPMLTSTFKDWDKRGQKFIWWSML
ncbi:GLPGLI family protein [Flavihumibacter profundi]|jgi:GLPGLI family protein|uniref:GLPGLI family protein n=1 Tax=Flavihumibacter profundi TaxID=2716883 RepID=UPI001CC5F483|nr:GLPGLI family protein [Flavihumibacter profundi]MBZ5856196.1 GLPGLI family protein [Flavihumibacter profundi]